MFLDESWKLINFGSKVKVMSNKNGVIVGCCTLVSAGFFWLYEWLTVVVVTRRCMLTLSSTMEKTPELFRRRHSSACLFVLSRHSRSVMLRSAGISHDDDDDDDINVSLVYLHTGNHLVSQLWCIYAELLSPLLFLLTAVVKVNVVSRFLIGRTFGVQWHRPDVLQYCHPVKSGKAQKGNLLLEVIGA